jgi:hypothetical protein
MPGFDRSGPMGQGSMTGRGMGKCNPDAPSTEQLYGFGRGMGCRRGFGAGCGGVGRGRGRGANYFGPGAGNSQPVGPASEHETLRAQADQLQQSLAAIQQRLDALEKKE